MLILLALAAWLLPPPITPLAAQAPQTLHCRIELAAGAKGKRCHVTRPAGRQVRSCTDADRQASHCDPAGGGRYVAWVVGTGGGRCRITKKKTKWDRAVYAKLSKVSSGVGSCDLYVETR